MDRLRKSEISPMSEASHGRINNTDATLLALWKYFHYCPLALNFVKEVADAYEEHVITPVCPSVTGWSL